MNRRIIPLLVALALAAACGKKDKRADGDLTGAETTEPALPVHEDPGPRLQRETGAPAPTVRPTASAEVDRMEKGDGYVVAVVPLPSEAIPSEFYAARYVVEAGGVHASAFGWSGTAHGDPARNLAGVIVRLQGSALPPKFTVRWASISTESWGADRRPGTLGRLDVTTPASVPTVAGLGSEFWRSAGIWFQQFGHNHTRHPFASYARARADYLAHGASSQPTGNFPRAPRSDLHQMMDLYSGMTSINEALQADRGLLLGTEDVKLRTVPISQVQRLALAPHPWDRMIGELGKQPAIEPLAAYIPADMAYLHFGDLRTFVKLVSDLDDWVSPIAQWLEERGGASHFMSRYEEQLVLERAGLAETLGHVAAKGVAITVSDPYLREGTDVSMLFHVANRPALAAALAAFEASSRRRHPDTKEETVTIGALQARRLFTPDLAVNQYRVEYGEVLAISNSRAALEHLVAAHDGKVPRLHEQGDFRYMRAVYPWTAEEDGFLFLSDAFVGRAVSPELKILEARRMHAQADLFAINYASLLRGWVDGTVSAGGGELVKAGYITEAELRHPDGAPITLTAKGGARSDWGTVARLVPIRDLETRTQPLLVTPAELDAYNRFRETYESYWRSYLDPIGARITRGEDGKSLGIDARMLPLIDASEYDRMIQEVGTQKVVMPERGGGLQWTLAIGKEARLRQELDGLTRGFIPGDNVGIGWLGDWVTFGVADRSGLWDMALRARLIPSWTEDNPDMFRSVLENLATFPVFAAVHVASKVGLAGLLTGLKTMTNDAAPGMVSWEQIEPYREIPVVRVGEGQQSGGEFGGLAVHYATVGDVFLIAIDKPTLLGQIDRHLAGELPVVPTGPPSQDAARDAQAALQIDAAETGWLSQTLLGIAEQAMVMGHTRVMEDFDALWRGRGERALSAEELRTLGVAFLGSEPRSPHGGSFSVKDGFPTHSLYGDAVRPNLPALPIADSPITRVLRDLWRLAMAIEFEGEGDHRGLHTVVHLRSR